MTLPEPTDTTIVAPLQREGHSHRFADRVRLYTSLDERLHLTTRFFAAAAVTNAALAELCSLPCPGRWRCAIGYFGVLGTALEALNVKWARHIEDGALGTGDLDSALVTLEQLEVERLLRQHRSQHFHHRALQQINWLLQWAHSLARPLRRCPSIRVYRQVLGHMRGRLGRPLDFALLDDRIGIGHALTRSIRELGAFPAIAAVAATRSEDIPGPNRGGRDLMDSTKSVAGMGFTRRGHSSLVRPRRWLAFGAGVLGIMSNTDALAGPAVGVNVGTTGLGADVNIPVLPILGVRVGYNGFAYHHDINQTQVSYGGSLHFSEASGLVDWYVLAGDFRLTAGIYGGSTRVDVSGRPHDGTYTINGTTYNAAQVGSLSGQLKFGNSVKPYVGLGWGNPFRGGPLTFTLDLGAIYGGTPSVSLTAHCGVAAPPGSSACTQLQNSVAGEQAQLASNVTFVKWYPVLNLGVSLRF